MLYSHCGDVLSWEGICRVANQQARFTNSTVDKRNMLLAVKLPVFIQ